MKKIIAFTLSLLLLSLATISGFAATIKSKDELAFENGTMLKTGEAIDSQYLDNWRMDPLSLDMSQAAITAAAISDLDTKENGYFTRFFKNVLNNNGDIYMGYNAGGFGLGFNTSYVVWLMSYKEQLLYVKFNRNAEYTFLGLKASRGEVWYEFYEFKNDCGDLLGKLQQIEQEDSELKKFEFKNMQINNEKVSKVFENSKNTTYSRK